MRNEQTAFRNGDRVFLGIAAHNAARPGIGIDQQHCSDDGGTSDHAKERVCPDRPQFEFEFGALLASVDHAEDHCGASDQTDDPAASGTHGPVRPAAEQCKCAVDRRDRFATRHKKSSATPDQKSTQRHDEGWNAPIGDQPPMERADCRAKEHAAGRRDHPDQRMAESQKGGKDIDLNDAHDDGAKSKQ